MDATELALIEKYLQQKLSNMALKVRPRPKKKDSAEVYLGEEFLAVIYLDDDEGERSYNLQMAILDFDLDEVK